MLMMQITVSGLEELKRRLDPGALALTIRRVLLTELQPIAAGIAAAAPKRSGKLASSIRARAGGRRDVMASARIVGPGYGHLVESGHRIVTGGRISRAKTFGGKLAAAASGRFTGHVTGQVPPHPFAAPVLEAGIPELEARLGQAIARTLGG